MKKKNFNLNVDYIRIIALVAVAVAMVFHNLLALVAIGIVYGMIEFILIFTVLTQIQNTLMWMITPKPEPKKEASIFELNNGVKK